MSGGGDEIEAPRFLRRSSNTHRADRRIVIYSSVKTWATRKPLSTALSKQLVGCDRAGHHSRVYAHVLLTPSRSHTIGLAMHGCDVCSRKRKPNQGVTVLLRISRLTAVSCLLAQRFRACATWLHPRLLSGYIHVRVVWDCATGAKTQGPSAQP